MASTPTVERGPTPLARYLNNYILEWVDSMNTQNALKCHSVAQVVTVAAIQLCSNKQMNKHKDIRANVPPTHVPRRSQFVSHQCSSEYEKYL